MRGFGGPLDSLAARHPRLVEAYRTAEANLEADPAGAVASTPR
jgi:hypothetical protein